MTHLAGRVALRLAGALLILLGIELSLHAATLPAYLAGQSIHTVLAALPDHDAAAFHLAVQQAQTAKFALQDWGGCAVLSGVVLLLVSGSAGVPAPRSLLGFGVLALAIPAAFAWLSEFGLFQSLERDQAPPWADSAGLALASVPLVFAVAAGWTLLHLGLLSGVRRVRVSLSLKTSWREQRWLACVSALNALFVALSLIDGAYWDAIPWLLALYFHMALAAVLAGDAAGAAGSNGTLQPAQARQA